MMISVKKKCLLPEYKRNFYIILYRLTEAIQAYYLKVFEVTGFNGIML